MHHKTTQSTIYLITPGTNIEGQKQFRPNLKKAGKILQQGRAGRLRQGCRQSGRKLENTGELYRQQHRCIQLRESNSKWCIDCSLGNQRQELKVHKNYRIVCISHLQNLFKFQVQQERKNKEIFQKFSQSLPQKVDTKLVL